MWLLFVGFYSKRYERQGHELAGLWFESGVGIVAARRGDIDRTFGKRLGAFYERVEGGDSVVS